MLGALFVVFVLIMLLIIIYHRIKYRRFYKLLEKFPGPKILLPLIGVAYDFRSLHVIIGSFLKYFRSYGSTYALWVFGYPVVVVSDPKHLKIVLNSEHCLDKEKRYQFARDLFGNGLIIAPGKKLFVYTSSGNINVQGPNKFFSDLACRDDRILYSNILFVNFSAKLWKKNRKLINPALNQKVTESFIHCMVKHCDLMLDHMEKHIPKNKLFDIDHFFINYAMDILVESALGISDGELPKPPGFRTDMHRLSELLIQRSWKVWLHSDFLFRLSPLGREFYKLSNKLEVYFKTIIEKGYAEFHSKQKEEVYVDNQNGKPFLEHLLSLEDDFTIQQLRDEVIVFLSAGIDTTSATFGYLLVCLGALKTVQEKVVEELLDVFGESDRPISIEDLSKLHYLERVIKETMRIFSISALLARNVDEDVDIGDYIIPKGASLVISVCATHRNEEFWPDPHKFDPDRFLPSEVSKRHPYSYLPFSAGPRNCIGKHYAMLSMKLMAAGILRKFKINTNIELENIQSNFSTVSRIVGGANISIEKRYKE